MTMILDTPPSINAPNSMALFDDTARNRIWYAPLVWKLHTVNGAPAITYYNNPSANVSFLQMIFAPWVEPADFQSVLAQAQRQGKTLAPVNYLGKNDGKLGSSLEVLIDLPEDEAFRFKANGGKGGTLQNPIPLVLNMNSVTGEIIADVVRQQNIGMVLNFSCVVRGAISSFEANVYVDYDRCYEVFSARTSWNWWLVSGDIQSMWQSLEEKGGVRVEILGGTLDQKALVYRMAEWLRDMFLKPTVASGTAPGDPNTGIINVSVRYERIHEHKVFTLEFRERDFIDAPITTAAFTGQHPIAPVRLDEQPMVTSLLEMASTEAQRVKGDFVPLSVIRTYNRLIGMGVDINNM